LWDQGYDVWLLDYRLSNAFRSGEHEFPFGGWSIDEIGEIDVPRAVKEVRRILREERGAPVPIYAFAHCVGAVGLQMAILQGKLGAEDLAAVCFNAIHPWIIPSPTNIVRSKLGAFTRDWISNELLDPILESREEVTAAQTMFDRLAFSVARYEEDKTERHGSLHGFWPDGGRNLSNAICDRMTLLYGPMWQPQH